MTLWGADHGRMELPGLNADPQKWVVLLGALWPPPECWQLDLQTKRFEPGSDPHSESSRVLLGDATKEKRRATGGPGQHPLLVRVFPQQRPLPRSPLLGSLCRHAGQESSCLLSPEQRHGGAWRSFFTSLV